jgi:RNA polymerase sigma-70 factor (ECF subfamily)
MPRGQRERSSFIRLVVDDDAGVVREPAAREPDWAILMARAQDGDRAAYHRLLQEITPYLRSLAVRRYNDPNEIEDAIQDVLLTVHSIRQTYDPARPFGPWLATIANRRFVDRLRRQGRKRAREVFLSPEHEAFSEPESTPYDGPDKRDLELAIGDLPAAQQQAVKLLKLKEMSLKEAAAVSGMSITSLKVSVHRALKNLRKKLVDRNMP